MAGTGRNLRGNFPWDIVAEPSPAKSRGKKQAQSGQAVVAESQAAASTAQATRISNMGDQIYASLPERVKAESTAAWAQCDGQLEGITLAQTLGAASMLKMLPEVRQRVHPAIQGNGEVQEVEVSGILATLTRESASEIFCSLDKGLNLNSNDLLLSGSIRFKPRMTREDGTGLGEFVTMAVQGVPISDKMIASLNGGESDLTKTWDVKPMLPRADRLSQPMLLLNVTGPNLNMLNLLVAAGLSKPDLEHLIMWQLNEAVGKPAVTEVCFQDTIKKTVLDDNGRSQHYPMAVDFNKHGKALVVCRAPADIEDILTKTKYRLEINCGQILDVPELHKLSLTLMLDRRFSFEQREELMSAKVTHAIKCVREARKEISANAAVEQLDIVQVKLSVVFRDGQRSSCREMTCNAASKHLKQFLGGEPFGIWAVVLQEDPGTGNVYWNGDTHIVVQGTTRAAALERRLRTGISGGALDRTSPITSVRCAKGETPKTSKVQASPARNQGEALQNATTDDLQNCIARALFANPAMCVTLPAKTKQGSPVQWVARPAAEGRAAIKQTTLDDLPDLEQGMQMDNPDVRLLLRDAGLQYSAGQLFAGLMTMARDEVLEMVVSEDEETYQLSSSAHYAK